MTIDAGLTVGVAVAAPLLQRVCRHILELALREAEDAAAGSAKTQLG